MSPRLKRRTLEIAITGEGITPKDISIEHLAELLHAATEVIAAVSADAGLPRIIPSLARVKKGSAAFDFQSSEPTWGAAVEKVYAAIGSRGVRQSPRVRHSLGRLFHAARVGALKVGVVDEPKYPYLIMAAPLEVEYFQIGYSRTLYGRVVGVSEFERGDWAVRIALDDGGRTDLMAEENVAREAARLFSRSVRAEVMYSHSPDLDRPLELRSLELWANQDLVLAMDSVRENLRKSGIRVPAKEWLQELDD